MADSLAAAAASTPQVAMLDHDGAGTRFKLVVEAEEMGTQGGVQRAVGDVDRLDGLRLGRKQRPQIERR